MSRDFSPQMHWGAYKVQPEIYTSNIEYHIKGQKPFSLYTEEELKDRVNHIAVHVTASGIYRQIRSMLSDESFEKLNTMIADLVKADFEGNNTFVFPKELCDWYFNRRDHYYHEPNDEELLSWIKLYFNVK